jgi:hypothetical protein
VYLTSSTAHLCRSELHHICNTVPVHLFCYISPVVTSYRRAVELHLAGDTSGEPGGVTINPDAPTPPSWWGYLSASQHITRGAFGVNLPTAYTKKWGYIDSKQTKPKKWRNFPQSVSTVDRYLLRAMLRYEFLCSSVFLRLCQARFRLLPNYG